MPNPEFDNTVGSGVKLEIVMRSYMKVICKEAPCALTVGLGRIVIGERMVGVTVQFRTMESVMAQESSRI